MATTNLPAIREDIEARRDDFALALAGDAPPDKFVRSIMLQFARNPELGECDRVSIIDACNHAANDGLLLDGREAALIIFNSKRGEKWVKTAVYLPMYQGLLKRVYKSGFVSTVAVHVVFEAELAVDETLGRPRFVYTAGDREEIIHDPIVIGERGQPALVYSIVRMRDGTISRDVMSINRVLQIAKKQKKNVGDDGKLKGIWSSEFLEMAKKTVLRHHTKTLPKDARMEHVLETIDQAEPFDETPVDIEPEPGTRKRRGAAAEKLAPKPVAEVETIDSETGEIGETPAAYEDVV